MRIAFSGKMGAGKSTAASYLEDVYGFATLSFSDRLKFNLIDIGIDIDRLFERKDDTVRTLMQVYGEAIRQQDTMHWVNHVLDGIALGEDMNTEAHVVDDLRYFNEGEALKDNGFVLVRLNKLGSAPMCSTPQSDHVSEQEWENIEFDYELSTKEGDIEGLYEQLDALVAEEGRVNDD